MRSKTSCYKWKPCRIFIMKTFFWYVTMTQFSQLLSGRHVFIESFVHAVLIFTSKSEIGNKCFGIFFFKFIPHDLLFHSVVTTFLIAVYNRGNLTSQLICCFLFDVLNLLSLNCDSLQTSVLTSVGKFHNCYSGIFAFHLRLFN